MSRLIQPRGLKYAKKCGIDEDELVEAYTASWIEISHSCVSSSGGSVEAYTASWIEIDHQPGRWPPS